MSSDFKHTAEPVADEGQLRETAGRMYEASDILQAIKSKQYASYDELVTAIEQRCEHLSNELTKNG